MKEEFRSIDARGMISPLPLLELKCILDTVKKGECVSLISDDVEIAIDIERFISATGHVIESSEHMGDGSSIFYIIKS